MTNYTHMVRKSNTVSDLLQGSAFLISNAMKGTEVQSLELEQDLVEMFFEEVSGVDGFSVVRKANSAVIIPPKLKYYYIPRIIIKNIKNMDNALTEYIETVRTTDIISTHIDEKHDIQFFLYCLIKNLTNSDCDNLEEYVRRYTQFIKDDTFSQFDEKSKIGELENNILLVRRTQDYYGPETPYIMKTFIHNKKGEYALPIIRYGVSKNGSGDKTAYIYTVQRGKSYKNVGFVQEIDKTFSKINSGIKEERNLTPSMIVALSVFIGMLHKEGIKDIRVADFLTRRYGQFKNVTCEEQRDNIQKSATDKLLSLFLRLNQHFEGFNIEAFPNDVDSYMHISLSNRIECNNRLLENCFLIGGGIIGSIDENVEEIERFA